MNVKRSANDARELAATVGAIPPKLSKPQLVLADAGYASEAPVEALHEKDILSLVTNRVNAPTTAARRSPNDHQKKW